MPLKEDNVQEKQDSIELAFKKTVSAANRGDVQGTQQAVVEAKKTIDANYKDPKENRVKQEEFIRRVNNGIEKQENKSMFLGVTLQVGFAHEAVLAVAAFNDRINHEQTTSMTVASFREYLFRKIQADRLPQRKIFQSVCRIF